MKQQRYLLLLSILTIAAFAPAVLAQGAEEDDTEDESFGQFILEAGTWIAQPTGVEMEPATRIDPANPFGTQPIPYDEHTSTDFYVKFGYEMRRNLGTVSIWFYDQSQDELALSRSSPGIFQWGETMAHPLYAGVNLDGLADAFTATGKLALSDFRLDYSRTAFESGRVSGKWFVGWRRVGFDRALDVSYFALVPGLPPLLPPLTDPLPDLDPDPDVVSTSSSFDGRGLEAGMDFKVPLWRDRLSLDAGFAVAALRGDTEVQYASTTNYYVLFDAATSTTRLLTPPYSEFGQTTTNPQTGQVTPTAANISQRQFKVGVTEDNRSTSAMVLETYLAVRARLWKSLDLLVGFRDVRYDNVAVELRPQVTTSVGGINVQSVTEIEHDATYEGFYFGLGFVY